MILKGNQRAGGQQLAVHLMNSFDNERVELADLRGAVAQDLSGAFSEWTADASATNCRKNLYSFSASPDPAQRPLSREEYFELLDRTERSLKLVGQPRAVVFHTKEGRDHMHAVWSRIVVDQEQIKSVQISHDRLKLRTVARDFAREKGLELPDGLKKDRKADRFNDRAKQENLGERQQKERNGISKEQRMADIATCWKETGNAAAFVQALEHKGYFIARGDQRAFVVVDLHGEVHSLSRQLAGVAKSKELKERLASLPLDKLRDISAAQEYARQEIEKAKDKAKDEEFQRLERDKEEEKKEQEEAEAKRRAILAYMLQRQMEIQKLQNAMVTRHMSERNALRLTHEAYVSGVAGERLAKQPKGLIGFLTRITGIQAFKEASYRREDARREQLHKEQVAALDRRHDREKQEMARRAEALKALEKRENRSAEVKRERDEFLRTIALVRKPVQRELKPEFDRAANPQVLQRTGTEDGKVQEPSRAEGAAGTSQKGKLTSLFARWKEALVPAVPKEPPTSQPAFSKAAKPPIDLVEAFNREVEMRRSGEDRDRDPGRDFDPDDPHGKF